MAWPKGKSRKQPRPVPTSIPDVQPVPPDIEARRVAAQRTILLHRMRRQFVPRELRMWDDLRLVSTMKRVRDAMRADGAKPDQLEQYVDRVLAHR